MFGKKWRKMMATAGPIPYRYTLEQPSAGGSPLKAFSEYTGTGEGIYKTLGVGQYLCDIGVRFASNLSLSEERVKDLSHLFSWISSSRKLLIVTKITSHTAKEFFKNFSSWVESGFELAKGSDFVYAFIDLSIDLTRFLTLFRLPKAAAFLLSRTGSVFSLIQDSWDTKNLLEDYSQCSDLRGHEFNPTIPREEKVRYVQEERNRLILKIAKTVLDVALSVFFFVGLLFGVTILPATIEWGIGLFSFGISYAADIYGRSMTYHLKEEDPKPKVA
jgi:hypothetical protein